MKRPLIYVKRITNLSDGRYCAGMGVDMLGFVINPGHDDFVSQQQYQEMSGWIAGPKRVVELASLEQIDINEAMRAYAPDLLHIPLGLITQKQLHAFPLLVEVPMKLLESLPAGRQAQSLTDGALDIRYVLITEVDVGHFEKHQKRDCPVLLSVDNHVNNVKDLLMKSKADGLSLQGTRELTPGLKDYDHLSRVLEEFDDS